MIHHRYRSESSLRLSAHLSSLKLSLSQSQLSTQEPPDAEATDADVLAEGALEVDASSSR